MTNEAIIFDARLKLMRDGKIGSTGRTIVVEDSEGNKTQMPEPGGDPYLYSLAEVRIPG